MIGCYPTLRALTDLTVAIVGADMQPLVDGQPVECGTVIGIRCGQILELQRARQGLRAYLTVAGGIDVPVMLGSRSTCLPAVFGGLQGRALREGDRLSIGPVGQQPVMARGRRLPLGWLEPIGEILTLRVTLGLQEDRCTPEICTFLSGSYRVTPQMDRVGARFRQISVPEACAVLLAYERKFDALRRIWQSPPGEWGSYRLRLGARSYRVGVEEAKGTYRVSLEGAERKSDDAEE